MKRCPRCGGTRFGVTAHVTQDWEVDGYENFVKCLNDCLEATHRPDDGDIWDCLDCNYSDAGSAFNVKELRTTLQSLGT